MKKIAILGSTGSIGRQALEVADEIGALEIAALTTNTGVELLLEQALKYKPKAVCIVDEKACESAKDKFGNGIKVFSGSEGLIELINYVEIDIALNAVVGSAGLLPTIKLIENGIDIALANKETLVCGGSLIMKMAMDNNVRIIPVDSEHSAIFQCLQGNLDKDVAKIHLTASGGPFRLWPKEKLECAKCEDALNHPNWSMGRKITIDSATLMNKGLELIEAKWLFNVEADDINIIVHPQSIIHSMVEFKDGTVMAQLGAADMRLPIAYAFTYPQRAELDFKKLDFFKLKDLTFEEPRYDDFACLNLAKKAIGLNGSMPACMNAANEEAVAMFLCGKIGFLDIPKLIEKAMAAYNYKAQCTIDDIIAADSFGREFVRNAQL